MEKTVAEIMDDQTWEKLWELNEKYHKVQEDVIRMETQGNTEDDIQEDHSAEYKWMIATFLTLIFTIGYIIVNFFHN